MGHLEYVPPIWWIGIGLKVIDLYHIMDNAWIGTNNNPSEWYIAYHGVKKNRSKTRFMLYRF